MTMQYEHDEQFLEVTLFLHLQETYDYEKGEQMVRVVPYLCKMDYEWATFLCEVTVTVRVPAFNYRKLRLDALTAIQDAAKVAYFETTKKVEEERQTLLALPSAQPIEGEKDDDLPF